MGLALVLDNADFSQNALRTISLDDYTWDDVTIPSSSIEKSGFLWGASGSNPGSVEYTGYWGEMWAHTDFITIPTGAQKIRGVSNALDLMFSSSQGHRAFPLLVFYDNNSNYISEVDGIDINPVTASVNYTTGYYTQGYKGNFSVDIPENATKYRLQWAYGMITGSATTAEKVGDISSLLMELPTIQIGS